MSFVEVRGLRVSYGAVQALRGISFDIPRGEVFGFIGPERRRQIDDDQGPRDADPPGCGACHHRRVRCGEVRSPHSREDRLHARLLRWRELAKKSLGKPRYVVRMLLVAEIPIVWVGLLASAGSFRRSAYRVDLEPMSLCVFVLWGIVVLILGVLGTSLIASERAQQTLPILLTTPIPRAEILRQKTRGLARLIRLFWVPFLTLALLGAWLRAGRSGQLAALYFVSSSLCALIYLPLLGWLAIFLGVRSRSRLRAFFLFLGCVLVWSAPYLLARAGGANAPEDIAGSLLLLSPITMLLVTESGGQQGVPPSVLFSWWAVALNAVIHGWVLYRLRQTCLSGADRYLRAV